MPTVREVVLKTTDFFKSKGIETARLDSELLIAAALGWDRMQVFLKLDYPMSDLETDKAREFVRRRSKGEPIAYILGEKGFYNQVFEVTSATLIPRPETEMLVERAVEFVKADEGHVVIADLGCGTGCIGLSIVAEMSAEQRAGSRVLLVDASAEALTVAKRNAEKLGLSAQCDFICADAGNTDDLSQWLGRVNLVVANPPYIAIDDSRVEPSVREYEPHTALFASEEGLLEVRRWTKTANALCCESALVLFEIGDGQAAEAIELFRAAGLGDISAQCDLAGRERMIEASKRQMYGATGEVQHG